MTWFLVAISGYFLFAVSGIGDKILLRQKATTKPWVYSFWVAVLSLFSFVIAPWGLHWPGWPQFGLAMLAGVFYFVQISCLYFAVDRNEASRVFPLVGGVTPIFVLLLSGIFLNESLTGGQIIAFFLLIGGGVTISLKRNQEGRFTFKGWRYIIAAILIGAIYFALEKYIFGVQGFVTGFVWSRLGLGLAALALLFWSAFRREIFRSRRQASRGLNIAFVSNKLISGVGSFLIHIAVALASVSLVTAMQGLEYVFLLGLTVLLAKKFPQILREKTTSLIIAQKTVAVILIAGGLVILAF